MNKQQVEAAVLAAIDRLRHGLPVEDDRIELKREWPPIAKARQLAGAANRARGDYVIYVIGADQDTGAVHSIADTDPADWWAQMASQFDQTPPDLLHHLNVQVAPNEAVAAIIFGTDRAPYVVKVSNGSSEREVPIRDGTRTRSAYRHELLRMLIPATVAPPAILLDASISGQWLASTKPEAGRDGRDESTEVYGNASIFVEHVGARGIFLPEHAMSCELVAENVRVPLRVNVWTASEPEPPLAFGVTARSDGVAITGPGRFALRLSANLRGDRRSDFQDLASMLLHMRLGVTGSNAAVALDARLDMRVKDARPGNDHYRPLQSWAYKH